MYSTPDDSLCPSYISACLLEGNKRFCVRDCYFDELKESLDPALYRKLFPILLCDNGTEFSNPKTLEFDRDGNRRSYVFYCDPAASGHKGACENNHEMIRRIIPKGVDITPYLQTQVLTMMRNINSYFKPDLGNRSSYELFEFYYGREPLEKLGIRLIPSNDILLRPAMLSHPDAQTINNKIMEQACCQGAVRWTSSVRAALDKSAT